MAQGQRIISILEKRPDESDQNRVDRGEISTEVDGGDTQLQHGSSLYASSVSLCDMTVKRVNESVPLSELYNACGFKADSDKSLCLLHVSISPPVCLLPLPPHT